MQVSRDGPWQTRRPGRAGVQSLPFLFSKLRSQVFWERTKEGK
jgi:hypothetical protein